jgi:uncharacterized protein YeaO (DUF488 family)
MTIKIKRAYEPPGPRDGTRVLVDRLWPRGISKATLKLDAWMKEIAPTNELRKWYGHEEAKWPEFRKRYFKELKAQPEMIAELRSKARGHTLTLVYSARETERNNAVALKMYLERKSR